MGRFLNKFKTLPQQSRDKADRVKEDYKQHKEKKEKKERKENNHYGMFDGADEGMNEDDSMFNNQDRDFNDFGGYDEMNIQPSQKPESFHHFILENQYKDLERSIRGFKNVYDQKNEKWILIRKEPHCFTDSEAEDILRTAQSHLATDIKLGRISKDTFGDYMDALYKQLTLVFERIAEYKYGRYNTFNDAKTKLIKVNFETQGAMKSMNLKIFLELWTRIQMNYSRAIGAAENIATHGSVKGQESLQGNGDQDYADRGRNYT